MRSSSSPALFNSPAIGLLCDLERMADERGVPLTVAVTSEGRVRVAPRSLLTDDMATLARTHRDALRLLVWCCDEAVQARRDVFLRILSQVGGSRGAPALRYRDHVELSPGQCVSCGDSMTAPVWCWRCQLAARLALCGDVPYDWIPAGTATAMMTSAA